MPPRYYNLDELIEMIDEPNRAACRQLLNDHRGLLSQAPGSSANHQAWPGGYLGHVTDVMNRIFYKVRFEESLRRLPFLPPEERYSLSDALLVGFLHDLEKPWKYSPEQWFLTGNLGPLKTKAQREDARWRIMSSYSFVLQARHLNALVYVEGIRDADYSPHSRQMWPLAVICHTADLESARHDYRFPLAMDDPWRDAS